MDILALALEDHKPLAKPERFILQSWNEFGWRLEDRALKVRDLLYPATRYRERHPDNTLRVLAVMGVNFENVVYTWPKGAKITMITPT